MALPSPSNCLPWWHPQLDAVPRTRVVSGCGKAGADGRIPCTPESMRANAEAQLRRAGYWTKKAPLSLSAYTLARHMASEHGSGSVEAKMLLALSTIQRARIWYGDGDPNKVLLYRHTMTAAGTYGSYGPIHGPSGIDSAPYGRWAATSLDPTIQDLLIADFALSGQADAFRHGADDQLGIKYFEQRAAWVRVRAAKNIYWIGHVPGVNPMETFFVTTLPNVAPTSPLGQELQQRAFALFDDPRTQAWLVNEKRTDVPWNFASGICAKPSRWGVWALTTVGVAAVGAAVVLESRPGGLLTKFRRSGGGRLRK